VELTKLLTPRFRGCIESGDLFSCEWVLHIGGPVLFSSIIQLEQLSSSMTEKLMKCHDQGKRFLGVLDE
jgi:hypothetical protein